MRSPAPRRAWTILELLVVFSIMALLAGVLIPALAGVQASGRSAVCVSNLRQMSIAAQRYALEYRHYPPGIRYDLDGGVVKIAWDWVTRFDGTLISPGTLWSFTDDPDRVQQCPDCSSGTNFTGDPYTGYNYNTTFIGGEGYLFNWGWRNFRAGVRPSACRHTGRVAIFGDGGIVAGVANKFMRAPEASAESSLQQVYAGGQAFRHHMTTNVAFLDLHVAPRGTPCPGARATPGLLDLMGYPANGFLSDDDRAYDPLWGSR